MIFLRQALSYCKYKPFFSPQIEFVVRTTSIFLPDTTPSTVPELFASASTAFVESGIATEQNSPSLRSLQPCRCRQHHLSCLYWTSSSAGPSSLGGRWVESLLYSYSPIACFMEACSSVTPSMMGIVSVASISENFFLVSLFDRPSFAFCIVIALRIPASCVPIFGHRPLLGAPRRIPWKLLASVEGTSAWDSSIDWAITILTNWQITFAKSHFLLFESQCS